MQVILREDVPKLGKPGDLVKVSDGFARNYLLPRKLAVAATTAGVSRVDHERRVVLARREKLEKTPQGLREKLENLAVTVAKPAGEGEKLYGSVTTRDIEDALAVEGVAIDRKRIRLDEPIRALGVFPARIALDAGLEATIKVWVVAK
jgi:large subunit ribosomal protein L9